MLVTYGHRGVGSCRFEQLKASEALFKSICNHTVRKDDHSLTKTFFDLQIGLVSRLEAHKFCFENKET